MIVDVLSHTPFFMDTIPDDDISDGEVLPAQFNVARDRPMDVSVE